MLTIRIGETESWDSENEVFVKTGGVAVSLEHSLVSLSKWEAVYEKPFLTKEPKTAEETLDYIRCMIVTDNVPPELLWKLSDENMVEINNYIGSKQSATWFNTKDNNRPGRETITSELVYYWMFAAQIPIECENWHLNRLLTLLKVFETKQSKPKKQSRADMIAERRRINAERRAQYGTTG